MTAATAEDLRERIEALRDEPPQDEQHHAGEHAGPPPLGDDVLREVETFLARFVSYPSDHARIAHVLWIVHTHLMDAWESTPRLAFLSPEPGSGKTRALEISELLVPNPIEAVNMSAAALFRIVASEAGLPTVLYDEVDTVFGKYTAEINEDVRGLLNAGHRRGQKTYRSNQKGDILEYEAYCAVALAGLGDLPDTLLARSVIVRMRRRAAGERVEPYRRRVHAEAGHKLRDTIAAWAVSIEAEVTNAWPDMPAGVEDRDADVWEPLLAVADAAGGEWPDRAREAAVTLVTEAKDTTPSVGIRLLSDVRTVFHWANNAARDAMTTSDLLKALCGMEEAPWSELVGGKPLNARGLASRLGKYGVKSRTVRADNTTAKGYRREDLYDAWSRYLPPSPEESVTSVTTVTPADSAGDSAGFDVTDTAHRNVTHPSQRHTTVTETAHETGEVTDVTDVTDVPGEGMSMPDPNRCQRCGADLPDNRDALCPACGSDDDDIALGFMPMQGSI